jgi:hypothetical protein
MVGLFRGSVSVHCNANKNIFMTCLVSDTELGNELVMYGSTISSIFPVSSHIDQAQLTKVVAFVSSFKEWTNTFFLVISSSKTTP